jgi:hypothetical protein
MEAASVYSIKPYVGLVMQIFGGRAVYRSFGA